MWPLCVISEKLFKMAGDDGGGAGHGPGSPYADGQIPLACRSYYVDVPHVQQAFTWDCGLACVLMVLRTLGVDCCDGIADLERLCRTTSIWTVDLAYLLNKEQLQEDIDRVDELFGKALDAGISIQIHQRLNEDSDYMGHYIIICGYDADDCEFEIRDPASSRKRERVTMKSLDEARKSFGTDEDILLISLTGKSGMKLTRKFLAGSM